jgi:hypothetical protein
MGQYFSTTAEGLDDQLETVSETGTEEANSYNFNEKLVEENNDSSKRDGRAVDHLVRGHVLGMLTLAISIHNRENCSICFLSVDPRRSMSCMASARTKASRYVEYEIACLPSLAPKG